MFSLLLGIIYLSFISLGLPDALLGSAWPIMHQDLHVPLSYSGSIYMTISFCTILSSLRSESLNIRFGTGKITAFSVLLTALALLGFSRSHSCSTLRSRCRFGGCRLKSLCCAPLFGKADELATLYVGNRSVSRTVYHGLCSATGLDLADRVFYGIYFTGSSYNGSFLES